MTSDLFPLSSEELTSNQIPGIFRFHTGLNRHTGKMVWNVTTGSYIDASPAINGNDVIVASDDGVVYVIDVVSGEVVSRYSDMAGSESSAAIGWDGIFVGSSDGGVRKLVFR